MERRRVGCGKILNVIHSGIKCKYQRAAGDAKLKDWRITPTIILLKILLCQEGLLKWSTAEQTIHAKTER